MSTARLTIKQIPGVSVQLEASGDYEPGEGGFAEELLMKAVEVVNAAMSERDDMGAPEIIQGHKETVRKVYGDALADSLGPKEIVHEPAPEKKIEPGTILRFPS